MASAVAFASAGVRQAAPVRYCLDMSSYALGKSMLVIVPHEALAVRQPCGSVRRTWLSMESPLQICDLAFLSSVLK